MRFDGRIAIVTGAGSGLGRAHALALAARGARVVVNDYNRDVQRDGDDDFAKRVADQIQRNGGRAISVNCSVTDPCGVQAMFDKAHEEWGRVDILVNNAGVLRDKSFANMTMEDFKTVLDVHLMGSVNCAKSAWPLMREQRYGRIMFTTSSAGLFGNFGQSNYSAAKMALVGLMQTLGLEGENRNIRVNCLAPVAATNMTNGLAPQFVLDRLPPEAVTPAMLALVSENAPSRTILSAGAGAFERVYITLTQGKFIGIQHDAPEKLAYLWNEISMREADLVPEQASDQTKHQLNKAHLARTLHHPGD